MRDRLAVLSGKSEAVTEMRVGGRGIRIEIDCPPERRDRFLGAPFHQCPIAERDVPPGIAIVERDRAHGVLAAGEQILLAIDPSHMRGKHQAEPQQASRRRVVRIGLDGAVRARRSPSRSPPCVMRQTCVCARATSSQAPRSSGGSRQRANALRGQQSRLDCGGDAAGDLVLHGEDVAELAVVAFGPVMAAGRRVDELRADAQPCCRRGARCLRARSARRARARPAFTSTARFL